MRKLIMWNLMTLNGFFEGSKPWDLEWHNTVWGEELERLSIEQLKSCDMLLFGRATYEGMAAYWSTEKGEVADLMNAIPKVVFSTSLREAKWNNTRLVKSDAPGFVREAKRQGNREMFVFGSARLSMTFINEDLFDEYRILIAPVLLPAGNPLFGQGLKRKNLVLVSSRTLSKAGVILTLKPGVQQ